MKITNLDAYKRLERNFEEKGYVQGIKDDMPIYCWDDVREIPSNLTPGHYVYAIGYGKFKIDEIPKKYLTREFFLHALSGVHRDIVEYVKKNPSMFDKNFFKDHIATDSYALEFELNDFEYMPLEYIDEEMVACAMFKAIDSRYVERRNDYEDWFYSVYKRKPEVLTKELYILGARCFAEKRCGENKFLSITPKEFRTKEFYYALCLENSTPVMEDIPKNILTTEFLTQLLKDNIENVQCFSEEALETKIKIDNNRDMELWKFVVFSDGYQIGNMSLNDERVEYFLSLYAKDSQEYEYGFKDNYKMYLREKKAEKKPKDDKLKIAGMMTLASVFAGNDIDSSIDAATDVMNSVIDRNARLPIYYNHRVPVKYSKEFDKEEYLLEIYKKIGIEVLDEADSYYYNVILPENLSITRDEEGYCVKNSNNEILIHYYDRGPFYDKTVQIDQMNITL